MIWALFFAMILDALLGEPRWLWGRFLHPAVMMGRPIGWADRRWNHGAGRRSKGILVMIGLVAGAIMLGLVLQALPGIWAEVIVTAILLAQRSLTDHVQAVADGLRLSLGDGRLAVSNIVSRDVAAMDASAVARSAIESGAENLSDGVVAPAFWFLIAGLPGLLVYKVTNTADSMIGYRTPRYAAFGWAAARLDDLLNLAPARVTAVIIWTLTPGRGAWRDLARDARLHRSPNAGWPEAAMARALGIALAGPRSYDGAMRDFPFVNAAGRRELAANDIEAAVAVLWKTWGCCLLLVLPLALL